MVKTRVKNKEKTHIRYYLKYRRKESGRRGETITVNLGTHKTDKEGKADAEKEFLNVSENPLGRTRYEYVATVKITITTKTEVL